MNKQDISSAGKFKAAGLRQRLVTALVITAVFLAAVLFSSLWYFQVFISVILLWAAWEWADLSNCGVIPVRICYTAVMMLCAVLLRWELFPVADEVNLFTLEQLMLTALCFWALVLLWVLTYPRSVGFWSSRQMRLLMGFLVLLPLWSGLVFLKQQDNSGVLVLWMVALVAVADIGAYFAGVRFGKRKLAPHISPGKSWEGVLGGMAANGLFAVFIAVYLQASSMEMLVLVLAMLLMSVMSVLGDLFESMLKRHRGVKDSGRLLPGHGGILDRIDGWTVVAPAFVLVYLYGVASH